MITYKDLIYTAKKRAITLNMAGVTKGTIVGIYSKNTLESLINILAVILSGGIFLPLDPGGPSKLFEHIVNETKLEYVITTFNESSNKDLILIKNVMYFNKDYKKYHETDNYHLNDRSENDSLYILYTSGSTGSPKGVLVSDRSFNNFRNSIEKIIEYKKKHIKFLCSTSFTFDISILETLVTLSYGGTCVIIDKNQKISPKFFRKVIENRSVNTLQFTPTYLSYIIEFFKGDIAFLSNVDTIIVGGEPITYNIANEILSKTNATLYNCYGPTEATIWSTCKKIEDPHNLNIGTPLDNYKIELYSKDSKDNEGEIYIFGDSVSQGYIKNKNSNDNPFFTNQNGERGYKTGDIAKYNNQGELVFIGRTDRQVKIKGFRVELDEIEHKIQIVDKKISRAAVVYEEYNKKKQLFCMYSSSEEIDISIIINKLREYLPNYMIPIRFVYSKYIPSNVNGKIDYSSVKNIIKKCNGS